MKRDICIYIYMLYFFAGILIRHIMCISHYMIPCSRLCKGYFQAYMVYMGVPKMEVPPNFMKTWTVDCLSMILV